MDFYNKTMDDIQHAGEVATLRAENAKKPQRVVRKVTERVNRIAKRKPGARPAGLMCFLNNSCSISFPFPGFALDFFIPKS